MPCRSPSPSSPLPTGRFGSRNQRRSRSVKFSLPCSAVRSCSATARWSWFPIPARMFFRPAHHAHRARAIDLSAYLPHASHTDFRALALGETPPTLRSMNFISMRWNVPCGLPASLNKPIIFYRPVNRGIGFINPSVMTRAAIGVALNDAPTGAWHVKNT
jgi:hypothetical protein